MKIEERLNTDCWFNYQKFYSFISEKKFKTLVEVGVWKGHSISYLARKMKENNTNCRIYAVDLWENTYKWEGNDYLRNQLPIIYDIYNENLKINGVRDLITDIKEISWNAASHFEDGSVDFVFIDADHEYDSVCKDIKAWMPKIRKGGIISGHDYFNPCGVKDAVNELVADFELSEDKVWFKVT